MMNPLNKTASYIFHNDIWVIASILSATCQVYLTYISLAKISTKWYYWSNFKVHVIIHSQLSQNPHFPTPPPFYTVYSGFHLQQATLTDIDFPILNQYFNLQHPFDLIPFEHVELQTWGNMPHKPPSLAYIFLYIYLVNKLL